MQGCFKFMTLAVFVLVYMFLSSPAAPAELVEPTRTLQGEQETVGRLTVLSEPPGLKITLDGNSLGKTPAFLVEVEAGIHSLRVKGSETDIYIEPGKTLKISLYKEEFILIPVSERKVEKKPVIEVKEETREAGFTKPRDPVKDQAEKNRREANERWDRFINGTKPFF